MKKRKLPYIITLSLLFLVVLICMFSQNMLTFIGEFLVINEEPIPSDAVVVLNTGVEYYPRLIEAAGLYKQGIIAKVVINGNRKTDTLREFEKKGFKPCCEWYEDRIRILEMLGVPRSHIVAVSVEDAYDTISESKAVGHYLVGVGISRILITTSKSHTRRAKTIWEKIWLKEFQIVTVAAKKDPYTPNGWWKKGRQIKWVLSEYGAWIFLLLRDKDKITK